MKKKHIIIGLCISGASLILITVLTTASSMHRNVKVSDWINVNDMNLTRFYTNRPKTYLLSFMGSGNTWMRYCIEYVTKRPTLEMRSEKITKINCPLGYWFDLQTDYDKDPIWKVHHVDYMKAMGTFDPTKETLIVIVRNYKEVLTRMFSILSERNKGKSLTDPKAEDMFNNTLTMQYLQILKLYDQWPQERRFMIYYKYLIRNPEQTLKSLLAFLQEPPIYLDAFIACYQEHKKACLGMYAKQEDEPVTQGNKTTHYSMIIDISERIKLDNYFEQTVPTIWNRYLKDRYAENT